MCEESTTNIEVEEPPRMVPPLVNILAEQGKYARKGFEVSISVIVALIGLAMLGFGENFGYFVLALGAFMTARYALKAPRPFTVSPEMREVIYDIGKNPPKHGSSGVCTDLTIGLGLGQQSPFID